MVFGLYVWTELVSLAKGIIHSKLATCIIQHYYTTPMIVICLYFNCTIAHSTRLHYPIIVVC